MRSVFATLGVVFLFLAIAFAGLGFYRSERGDGSFWDVILHPDSVPDLDGMDQDAEQQADAIGDSPKKVEEVVRHFVFEVESADSAFSERRLLTYLGEKAYPAAMAILSDSSLYDKLVHDIVKDRYGLPEPPFCRLCYIFDMETPPPAEAAPLLSPFLDAPEEEVRKSAALIIGAIGRAECLPDLQRAMKDEESYVRSYALMGVQRAVSQDRIPEADRVGFFDFVANLWPEYSGTNGDGMIPEILLSLDRDRGVERLFREDVFHAEFGGFRNILEVFNRYSVEVPRETLIPVIEQAEKDPDTYPAGSILEESLFLLGSFRNEEDLALLERFLDHPNEQAMRGAVKGLYEYHDFFSQVRDPWEVESTEGWDALTQVEKHLCAVGMLRDEVNNGGFAQYYFNSSGDTWEDALSGLKAIGAKKRLQMMEKSLAVFGETPPSPDRETRNEEMAQFSESEKELFDELDSAWYEIDDEPFDRLFYHYNMANRDGRPKE